MTMEIGNKLKILRKNSAADPDLATRLAKAGRDAILAGMLMPDGKPTDQWKALMEFVTDKPTELARLCGQDPVFNASEWGRFCLAYIAGDSTCTSETPGVTGTRRTMVFLDEVADRRLLEVLDMEQTEPE